MDEKNSLHDLDNLVRKYLYISMDLASQDLSLKDFHNQLYRRLSCEVGIDERDLEYITQPLANLHFFQNRNGRNRNRCDSWIDILNGKVILKEKPTGEEITKVLEPFLKMYGKEINNRILLYNINISR